MRILARLVSAALVLPALAQEPAQRTKKRVLVYTHSAGFEHEVVKRTTPDELSLVERVLRQRGEQRGWFEAFVTRDAARFTREGLADVDLIFFYTTGELPWSDANKQALFEFVESGKGFAGAHPATDTFYTVPEYGRMVGGYFDNHPWHERVKVEVEVRDHLATRHLGASFDIVDEIYQFKAPWDRKDLRVLMRLDPNSIDVARAGVHRTDKDFALAWCKDHGRGRVFYTALGHRPEVWADERFLKHLEGGLAWAMRAEEPFEAAERRAEALDAYRRAALEGPGDAQNGARVFRLTSGPMCIRCHVVFGEGSAVGPELSDVGARFDRAGLIESILAPSARIAEGYRTWAFELADGREVYGQLRGEDGKQLEIYDSAGELRRIERAAVVRRSELKTSLMPEGLAHLMSREDFADLTAYLAALRGAPK